MDFFQFRRQSIKEISLDFSFTALIHNVVKMLLMLLKPLPKCSICIFILRRFLFLRTPLFFKKLIFLFSFFYWFQYFLWSMDCINISMYTVQLNLKQSYCFAFIPSNFFSTSATATIAKLEVTTTAEP